MNGGRQYEILGVLGRGGFGTVYQANLTGTGGFTRRVAVKVLNREMEANADLTSRLRDEARLLGLVRHRAIVQVDGLVVLDGRWAVVMEHIDGTDLFRLMSADGVPPGPALEIIAEVSAGLAAAHDATTPEGEPLQLLHRDLKPSNILLSPHGEVKIVDFGGARGNFSGREASTRDVTYGSPGYLAPERVELVESPAGDVFSLGMVLFEMLTGTFIEAGERRPKDHVRRLAGATRLARDRGIPEDAITLALDMTRWNPPDRPTPREVEGRARTLRGTLDGPWLSDWARAVVPPLTELEALEDHDLPRAILTESDHLPPDPTPDPVPVGAIGGLPTEEIHHLPPPPTIPHALGRTADPALGRDLSSRRPPPEAKTEAPEASAVAPRTRRVVFVTVALASLMFFALAASGALYVLEGLLHRGGP